MNVADLIITPLTLKASQSVDLFASNDEYYYIEFRSCQTTAVPQRRRSFMSPNWRRKVHILTIDRERQSNAREKVLVPFTLVQTVQ